MPLSGTRRSSAILARPLLTTRPRQNLAGFAYLGFSTATARAADGKIVWRKRLEHADRGPLREELRTWPEGTPVVLEGTFGWGWLSDELSAAGLEPHLASSKKVAAWRDARGLAKSNRTDADLLSELWTQQPRWWEVWLVPP